MSRIAIASIVEGQGEDESVCNLLWQTWFMLGGEHVEHIRPIRRKRGTLLKESERDLEKAIEFAALKLAQAKEKAGLILILIDAEDDCEKLGALGPILLNRAKAARSDLDISCVIANVMFETWLVATAESLRNYLNLDGVEIPEDPEASRAGKGWIKRHIKGGRYKETVDQPRLTSAMDLKLCRDRSRSYDKLCREFERRLGQVKQGAQTA